MHNNYPELTLLSEEQLLGDNKLKIIEQYGAKAVLTDLAILTGGTVFKDDSLNENTGYYWTSSSSIDGNVRVVSPRDTNDIADRCAYGMGIRPALQSDAISNISLNVLKGNNGIEEVEYGEYPQMVADADMQNMLEQKHRSQKLVKTGKSYTLDLDPYIFDAPAFQSTTYEEYSYLGKKYIRVKGLHFDYSEVLLSNGCIYRNGAYVWVEVSPVKWIFDRDTYTLISKKILLSGIPYCNRVTYYRGDFKTTNIKKYMDKHMSKDLFSFSPLIVINNEKNEINQLIRKIQKLVEPLEDGKERQILSNVNRLIEQYKKDIQILEPGIFFDNTVSLDIKHDFASVENNLIIRLESIIRLLHENDKYLKLLDEINRYRELTNQPIEIPSQVETVADKVLYIIAVSNYFNKPEIKQELIKIFDQITNKISIAMSLSIQEDIMLTLEGEENVRQLFSKYIHDMFSIINKYHTVQMALRGIGDNALAQDFQQLLFIIQSLHIKKRTEVQLKIDQWKEEYNLDVCVNNSIEDIISNIRRKLQTVLEELYLIVGSVEDVNNDILRFTENKSFPIEIRTKVKQELATVFSNWKEKLLHKETIDITTFPFQNLNENVIMKLLLLKDLYRIQYSIESYIENKKRYDEVKII